MKQRMGEDVEKSQADSHVYKIMNAVTWIGGCILEISSLTGLQWSFFSMLLLVIQEN
jgi:hypothetical protein